MQMTKMRKRWALALGGAVALLLSGYFALTTAVEHFLDDGGLARAIGKKTAVVLKGDAGYLPLFWRGLTVRSEGLLVRGKPPAALIELRAEDLRASCSLRALWQRKFMINRLEANRLEVAFGAAAAEKLAPILAKKPELQPQVDTPSPLKLEIRETIVRQMDIYWGAQATALGSIREAVVKFYPDGSALNGVASEGTLEQTGWPRLRIVRVETHYAKPQLEIRSAHFAIGKEEDLTATGRFEFKEGGGGMQLQLQAKKAPAILRRILARKIFGRI